MKIDSHQHFWIYSEKEYGWIDESMAVIRKNHLPQDLKIELQKIGFDGSIAVQARQTLEETAWLLELADSNPIIKGVVGWVDLRSNDLVNQLNRFTQHKKFVGVRHVIQDEPQDDFMLLPEFIAGIQMLQKYNLTYDILVYPKHLKNTVLLVEQCPNQTFVVDHIAKPFIKDGILHPWKEDIEHLAKYPNVYCKVSGMVTETDWKSWKPEDFKPYLDTVFNAFGTDRIMIGSDYPVCKVAGEYSQVMGIVIEYTQKFSDKEQAQILGLNALKAYQINS
jgi:L-fuconolactonase